MSSSASSVFEEVVSVGGESDLEVVRDKKIGYDARIIPVLEDIKRQPRMENDSVILITGRPGVGKSKLAMDIAYYLDPSFNIDRIVFNVDDLIEAATKNLPPGSAIIFDEAAEAVDSVNTLGAKNQRMAKFLATVRSRCLYIILVQPSFWSFMMSIATERSDILFNVFKTPNKDYDRNDPNSMPFTRGYYNVYNYEAKKYAYIAGKKWHIFKKGHKPTIQGLRFGGRWIVDKDEYQRRKDIAVARMNEDAEVQQIKNLLGRDTKVSQLRLRYIKSLRVNGRFSLDTICNLLGENKRAMTAVLDYEAKKMFDIP